MTETNLRATMLYTYILVLITHFTHSQVKLTYFLTCSVSRYQLGCISRYIEIYDSIGLVIKYRVKF